MFLRNELVIFIFETQSLSSTYFCTARVVCLQFSSDISDIPEISDILRLVHFSPFLRGLLLERGGHPLSRTLGQFALYSGSHFPSVRTLSCYESQYFHLVAENVSF